jgi:hypothetical protein
MAWSNLPYPIPPSQPILLTTKAAAFSVPEPESEQLPIPHFLGIIQPPKTVAASITLAPSTLPTPSSPIAPAAVILLATHQAQTPTTVGPGLALGAVLKNNSKKGF